jgi:SEFIR domain
MTASLVVIARSRQARKQSRRGEEASMPDGTPLKVFISYSHDGAAHEAQVLALANRLRTDGIDAMIDLYVQSPPEGWPAWCDSQIRQSQSVLMVCTASYRRRVEGNEEPGIGHGVLWEGRLIKQHLYDSGSVSSKFVPVLLADGSPEHIPTPVRGGTIYRVESAVGYEALLRLLTDQPATRMPPIGPRRELPPREQVSEAHAASSISNQDREAEMVALLKAAGPHKFQVNLITDDSAARTQAQQIYEALVLAGWVPTAKFPVPVGCPGIAGVMISKGTDPRLAQAIQSAFSRAGIRADMDQRGNSFVSDKSTVEIFVSR